MKKWSDWTILLNGEKGVDFEVNFIWVVFNIKRGLLIMYNAIEQIKDSCLLGSWFLIFIHGIHFIEASRIPVKRIKRV